MIKTLLPILLLAFLLLVQYRLWLSEGGYTEQAMLSTRLIIQQQENQQLLTRNQLILAEIEDLKQGLAVVEELARSQLGLIKTEEVFYHIVEAP